jgi:ribosome-associated toxin RatA of RatAB toxin-antitoxin module
VQPMPLSDHAEVTETIFASPEKCFAVATDLDSYPSWASGITSVDVRQRDADGRPLEAVFQAEAMGRRTRYVLAYDYAEAPTSFRWRQLEGDLTKRLDGAYRFDVSAQAPDATDVTYELDVDLAVPLPGFVKRRAETKIVQAALHQFRGRAETV